MSVTPFRIDIPDSEILALQARLRNTRWPHPIVESGWERGVPQAYARRLTTYWLETFDWRKQEAWLNRHDQFIAEIDGQQIHFFHVRSPERDALPLLLLHGWPSSGVEFVGLIDRLTNPVAHGGDSHDAFDVVIPTIPGFGLSTPVTEHWDAMRTARAYGQLMRMLGCERWGVHGSDVGADIAGELNHLEGGLVGVHVSTDMPSIVWYSKFTGSDPSANPALSDLERAYIDGLILKGANDGGYLEIQRTRPLTIGYLLNDSPVGQLTWIAEKFKLWSTSENAVDLDQLLTNISLYWFTMSGSTAADFLCSNLSAQREWGRPSFAPMGMAVFGSASSARTLMDPGRQLAHWSEFALGGHFPAMEVPALLVGDLRAYFRSLR